MEILCLAATGVVSNISSLQDEEKMECQFSIIALFRISDFSPELRDKIRNRKPGIEATITVALCRHFCSNSGIYLHPQAFPDSSMQKQSIREASQASPHKRTPNRYKH